MDAPGLNATGCTSTSTFRTTKLRARIRAALAAGGHIVTDQFAPDWWVLADSEGNEACVVHIGWEGDIPTFQD